MKSVHDAATQQTFVAYYRVSTKEQGKSGLGLEAQQKAVQDYVQRLNGVILSEFTDIESGKRSDNRPELDAALKLAKKSKATLVIAKLDRLSRNVAFIATLQDAKVKFVCVDMPEANETMIHIFAAFAQYERKRISERTKEGLAAAKARGVKLGNPNLTLRNEKIVEDAKAFAESLRITLTGYKKQGLSERKMVEVLNSTGVKTIRGKEWNQPHLHQVLVLLNLNG